MNNSLNKENDQFLATIKSTIGKDIIETKAFFNDYQIIVPSKKMMSTHSILKLKRLLSKPLYRSIIALVIKVTIMVFYILA